MRTRHLTWLAGIASCFRCCLLPPVYHMCAMSAPACCCTQAWACARFNCRLDLFTSQGVWLCWAGQGWSCMCCGQAGCCSWVLTASPGDACGGVLTSTLRQQALTDSAHPLPASMGALRGRSCMHAFAPLSALSGWCTRGWCSVLWRVHEPQQLPWCCSPYTLAGHSVVGLCLVLPPSSCLTLFLCRSTHTSFDCWSVV